MKIKYYLMFSVSLATFLVYLSTLNNGFVSWDDNVYIYENPHIRAFGADFFRWIFGSIRGGYWHPLTWVSHALDYALWGLNPLGHHLTSSILHAVNTFVAGFLIIRLFDAAKERTIQSGQPPFLHNQTVLIATGVTVLLFGLHPIHVESVAWVSERKDLLCALFYMLSIMMYIRYVCKTSPPAGTPTSGLLFFHKHYLFALGLFILALLSKPMAVTLPVVLLILDWYPLGRIRSLKVFQTAFTEKLPFVTLSLVLSIETVLAQKVSGALATTEAVPLSTRAFVGVKSLIAYLWKMILPLNLTPFYPFPREVSLLSFKYLSVIALVGGITITCIVMAKKQRLWLSVWSYYVITLLPVLGIVQVGRQSMADRYTYLPSLGPFLVAGIAIAIFWNNAGTIARWGKAVRMVSIAAAIAIVVYLSYATLQQIRIWKNSFILWNYVIEKEPGRVAIAYYGLGAVFLKMGLDDQAMAHFDRAIAIDPSLYGVYDNQGVLYSKAGKFHKAIEAFNKSIATHPNWSAYGNRGLTYYSMGQYDRAKEDLDKAIELNEHFDDAYINRGKLHLRSGNKTLALTDFQRACDLGSKDGCLLRDLFTK